MLSDDKISSLTHLILASLVEKKWAVLLEEEPRVLREIRNTIASELKIQEQMDHFVRDKIMSLSRRPVEGSPEWEVLYKKYLHDEQLKRQR